MKILLIYPYFLEERIHKEDIEAVPIGLFYIGAVLKEKHHDVEILNWHDIQKFPEKIKETLVSKNPDVIGMSIVHANRWGGIEISRIAKNINPDLKIVFGGIGATFLYEHLLTHFKEIDFCVLGEGEYAFLQLVQWLERKKDFIPETISGIAYRKHDKIITNSSSELIKNLDDLPDPARYFNFQHVCLSRGCPGNCTFCGSPRFWKHRVRFHSADYFVDQLERLYQKGITFFYFSDDTFALKKDLVKQVCEEICRRKLFISWAAICRVADINEDVLYWMRKAGCVQISYGIESGSEKIRRYLNKPIKTETIKKVFSLTTSYGILPRAYFIYGCPEETWESIGETIDLIRDIKPLAAVFYILDIFPGTKLYKDWQEQKDVDDDIWKKRIEDILYFETDSSLSQEQIPAFGKKLRDSFHRSLPEFIDAIRLIDRKDLYVFHADFLSRLAMTFSHGDYSQIEVIEAPDEIAVGLYKRALLYYPDHRAFLGTGIIYQKKGFSEESLKFVEMGLKYYPKSEQLHICRGVSLMNMRNYESALAVFEKFPDFTHAKAYGISCREALAKKRPDERSAEALFS
jgi:anaerobic magnesium-protoporphyrin IX monomethyl ester cyclase